jgi:hypothetical protein
MHIGMPCASATRVGRTRRIGLRSVPRWGNINQSVEVYVSKLLGLGFALACAAFVTSARAASTAAAVQEDFPLSGTYMQNVPCKGDGSDKATLKVKISPQQIVSNLGVCTILDNKQAGKSYKLHVECKFPAGPLVGDLTFTPQPDKTVKFVDRDNTYNAILHRCPN